MKALIILLIIIGQLSSIQISQAQGFYAVSRPTIMLPARGVFFGSVLARPQAATGMATQAFVQQKQKAQSNTQLAQKHSKAVSRIQILQQIEGLWNQVRRDQTQAMYQLAKIYEKGNPLPEMRTAEQKKAKLDELEKAKRRAADEEDYDLAKKLKGEIEELKRYGVLRKQYMCPRHKHQELAFFDFTAHEPICRDCKDPLMGGHVPADHAVKRIDEAATDLRTATHGLRAGVTALFAFSETAMLDIQATLDNSHWAGENAKSQLKAKCEQFKLMIDERCEALNRAIDQEVAKKDLALQNQRTELSSTLAQSEAAISECDWTLKMDDVPFLVHLPSVRTRLDDAANLRREVDPNPVCAS